MKPVAAAVSFVTLLSACSGGGAGSAPDVTFQRDIRPIVESRCVACHQAGGVAPLDFTDAAAWADGAPTWAAAATGAVAAGSMPPWMPSGDCKEIEDARGLTADEKQAFADWAANDHAAGDQADFVSPDPVTHIMEGRKAQWGEPSFELSSPDPYQIQANDRPDDYRCIVMDHDFTQDTWIRGAEVRPDQKAYVHHLILYQFDSTQVEQLQADDAADPDVGYPCFGNPDAQTIMAWAPGQNGEFLPDDTARFVSAGSKWVIQVHYNTLGRDPATVPMDHTSVAIWEFDGTPSQAVLTIPFPKMDIQIPSGDPHVVQKDKFSVRQAFGELPIDLPVMGVMGHMHQLGTAISLKASQTGLDDTCLLDIPKWDFNWQQTYYYPEDAWFMANSDTTLHMTCEYDNSAANQIVVNGVARDPQDVAWGENTTDEMCLTYALVVLPSVAVTN